MCGASSVCNGAAGGADWSRSDCLLWTVNMSKLGDSLSAVWGHLSLSPSLHPSREHQWSRCSPSSSSPPPPPPPSPPTSIPRPPLLSPSLSLSVDNCSGVLLVLALVCVMLISVRLLDNRSTRGGCASLGDAQKGFSCLW